MAENPPHLSPAAYPVSDGEPLLRARNLELVSQSWLVDAKTRRFSLAYDGCRMHKCRVHAVVQRPTTELQYRKPFGKESVYMFQCLGFYKSIIAVPSRLNLECALLRMKLCMGQYCRTCTWSQDLGQRKMTSAYRGKSSDDVMLVRVACPASRKRRILNARSIGQSYALFGKTWGRQLSLIQSPGSELERTHFLSFEKSLASNRNVRDDRSTYGWWSSLESDPILRVSELSRTHKLICQSSNSTLLPHQTV